MSSQRSSKELILNKFFTDINESVINSIYKLENFKEVNEGNVIYRAGDHSNELFLLLRGDVKIKFPSHNYISNKIFNDFFGEKELIDKTRRNSSAVANNNCLLYTIQKHIFETLISKSESIKKNVETFGEIKIPELNSVGKSRIDLTKSAKPRLFRAIYSRDEEETQDNDQNVAEAVSEINDDNIQVDDPSVELENEIINEEKVESTQTIEPEEEIEQFEAVRSLLAEERGTQKGSDEIDIKNLLDFVKSIHQPIKVYDTIQSIIKNLQRISYCDAGQIYLVDNKTSKLKKLAIQKGNISTIDFSSSEGLTGTCALQRNTINLVDPVKDSRFDENIDQPGDSSLTRIIYLPLLGQNEYIVGVLQLARYSQAYSDKDVESLELITKHAALAIEKSNSLEKLIETKKQQSNDDIEKFLEDNLMVLIDIIKSYTSLLNKESFSQKIKDMITLIKNQTNFTWDIIQSVFNYKKNDFNLNSEKVNINDFMNSITELLSDYCGLRNISLLRKIGDDTDVIIDSGKLFMAIFQLIENACNVTKEGGKVFISSSTDEDFVRINVGDEGPGVPDELHESIFAPGFSNSKKRSRFGLPIAKKIVDLHSGQLRFTQNSKTGSTFIISIPVLKKEDETSGDNLSDSDSMSENLKTI